MLWLLDPAVKKIFIENNQTYAWVIPLAIIFAFSAKGICLYLARIQLIKTGQEISGELQTKVAHYILNTDIASIEQKHSGKFISNINFDAGQVNSLCSTGILKFHERYFDINCFNWSDVLSKLEAYFFALIMMPLAAGWLSHLVKELGKQLLRLVKFLEDFMHIYQKF